MAKKKSKPFSVTKAVKANARAQVGQPPPEKVIVSEPRESRRERRHKASLNEVLHQALGDRTTNDRSIDDRAKPKE